MIETSNAPTTPDSIDKLIEQIYGCKACENKDFAWCFEQHKATDTPHKFPPIGALDGASVVFVALNPRFSEKPGKSYNVDLHQYAMETLEQFTALARNVDNHGNPYIADPSEQTKAGGWEEFYKYYVQIVKEVYGCRFGDVAVATEMFFCASPGYGGIYRFPTKTSPCAKEFLLRTINLVQTKPDCSADLDQEPCFIVTFGSGIPQFFARNVVGIDAYVIHLPFVFSTQVMGGTQEQAMAVEWVISLMTAVRTGASVPQPAWTGHPHEVWKYTANSKPARLI